MIHRQMGLLMAELQASWVVDLGGVAAVVEVVVVDADVDDDNEDEQSDKIKASKLFMKFKNLDVLAMIYFVDLINCWIEALCTVPIKPRSTIT